jgi:CDP-diacylglycerol--serine O-phosphatidyltransferase
MNFTDMQFIYLLPNSITTLNLFFGFYAIVNCLQGNVSVAFWSIIFAGFCDMLDGQIARLTKTTSDFGLQYDSLSDLVSFGVAPSLILYQWQLKAFSHWGFLVCFFFMISGALRLARFNVMTQNKGSGLYSHGLPITIAASTLTSFGIFCEHRLITDQLSYITLFLTLLLSFFMLSSLKFFSLKKIKIGSNKPLYFTLFICLSCFIVFPIGEAFFLSFLSYLAISFWVNVLNLFQGINK